MTPDRCLVRSDCGEVGPRGCHFREDKDERRNHSNSQTAISVAAKRASGRWYLVHYCQQCDVATAMLPRADVAVCPGCGRQERAVRLALFVVTGASGSGKTAILPHLTTALPGCAVFDVDLLIDSFKAATGSGSIDWSAFRDAWLSVAHGLAQGGRHVVLLGPFMPEQLDPLPARSWVGEIHFAVLDCGDDVRRQRLEARPPWRERAIEEHLSFAAHLRRLPATLIFTDDSNPARTADRVATWVIERLT